MESLQSNYARELGSEVSRAKLEAEHEAALIDVKLMRERLLASVHAKDNLARKKFQAQLAAENKHAQYQLESAKNGSLVAHLPSTTNGSAPHTNGQAPAEALPQAGGDPETDENLANKKDRLKDMLLWALMENPNLSKQALSAHVGASPGTIRKYLDELLDEGKLRTTNKTRSGFMVVQGDAMMN
jgi:Winged helix-turn-helix DNA-binding